MPIPYWNTQFKVKSLKPPWLATKAKKLNGELQISISHYKLKPHWLTKKAKKLNNDPKFSEKQNQKVSTGIPKNYINPKQ